MAHSGPTGQVFVYPSQSVFNSSPAVLLALAVTCYSCCSGNCLRLHRNRYECQPARGDQTGGQLVAGAPRQGHLPQRLHPRVPQHRGPRHTFQVSLHLHLELFMYLFVRKLEIVEVRPFLFNFRFFY